MSYIPPQEYELGTVWVPFYSNGQIFMIPIRPTPIQPNPKPRPDGRGVGWLPPDFVITPEIRERIRRSWGMEWQDHYHQESWY